MCGIGHSSERRNGTGVTNTDGEILSNVVELKEQGVHAFVINPLLRGRLWKSRVFIEEPWVSKSLAPDGAT
jgi:hypothetical protein